jgi:hypothetical protein
MNNEERNKYLTEKMGVCWHEWDWQRSSTGMPSVHAPMWCSKCKSYSNGKDVCRDFDTWVGFGLLWEWANKQEWFWLFTCKQMFSENADAPFEKVDDDGNFHKDIIHPTRFADALYEFLKN